MRISPSMQLLGVMMLATSLLFVGGQTLAKEKKEKKAYTIDARAASVAPGATGSVELSITSINGYKWNKKFPASVQMESGATPVSRFEKVKFSSKDFKVGKKGKKAGLKITYTAVNTGRETVTATARFSVCNEDACLVKTETIKVDIAVK